MTALTLKKWLQPEVRCVGVPPHSEETEVMETDPRNGSVAQISNSAVQTGNVARDHSHVARVAANWEMSKSWCFG